MQGYSRLISLAPSYAAARLCTGVEYFVVVNCFAGILPVLLFFALPKVVPLDVARVHVARVGPDPAAWAWTRLDLG